MSGTKNPMMNDWDFEASKEVGELSADGQDTSKCIKEFLQEPTNEHGPARLRVAAAYRKL